MIYTQVRTFPFMMISLTVLDFESLLPLGATLPWFACARIVVLAVLRRYHVNNA